MKRVLESHRKGTDRLSQKVIWEAKVGEQEASIRDYGKKGGTKPLQHFPLDPYTTCLRPKVRFYSLSSSSRKCSPSLTHGFADAGVAHGVKC